jgi:Family of unknown function (DUF6159)
MGRVKHGLALAGQSWQIIRSNRSLLGGAWSVISPLAIPAIALEDAGPLAAIKRSASLFKQHWSGRVVGMAAIGFGVFLAVMLPAVAIVVVGVLVLQQVFAVVLYRYTTSGQALGGFAAEDLERSVRTRPAVARA